MARRPCPGHFRRSPRAAVLEAELTVDYDGWVAARRSSDARDSHPQPVFAHTSPVYVNAGVDGPHKRETAVGFDGAIQRSLEWCARKGGSTVTDSVRRSWTCSGRARPSTGEWAETNAVTRRIDGQVEGP